ncbi:MAG: non-canonical purine NTP pyrophosphatase, RdgB/HAM1 family [Rhodospirillaceae bacterium]|nr:non-canonical purine NTP pyrophosphatase, RdgB/HAM1 family [Alphaproteobacteria bacterium]MBR71975.1 non-canonical purine NTP pyrophosphatase, RdgB/HAM1 family [Rhodospirillaceae bacterium]|tara:strand:- start:12545 stop:13168 length:624 start_codon:yes stop_codon:yes gene_type:complete
MPRVFKDNEIVIASHNSGKVTEIGELLKPFGMRAISASNLGLEEPDETGKTFSENAELKAKHAASACSKPALADDSGLCVDLLGGKPGIYSARWAGKDKNFSVGIKRIENEIIDSGETPGGQSAYFICALSLCWEDFYCDTFVGRIDGTLSFPPRGQQGFGYDPIFIPNGFKITFGEMNPKRKHAMSHRASAFKQLVDRCIAINGLK